MNPVQSLISGGHNSKTTSSLKKHDLESMVRENRANTTYMGPMDARNSWINMHRHDSQFHITVSLS